jgi:EEF1A N-terminal glycine/lysine methyltransferase
MYSSRISAPLPPEPQSEDIFSAALSTIFTDDVQNSHGTPGSSVIYHSPQFGNIELQIPQHPDVEEGRKLFAHYLWNAGVICADAIEFAGTEATGEEDGSARAADRWDKRYWDMRGKRILELGAGT